MINQKVIIGINDFPFLSNGKEIKEYLVDKNTTTSIDLVYFLQGDEINNLINSKVIDFLRTKWFSNNNAYYFTKVAAHLKDHFNAKPGVKHMIFSEVATLSLLEAILIHTSNSDKEINNDSYERDIFEAYLKVNHNHYGEGNDSIEKIIAKYPPEEFNWLLITPGILYSDLINRDLLELFMCELIKSYYLLNFLDSRADTKGIVSKIISAHGCDDWKEYLACITSIALLTVNTANKKGNSRIQLQEDFRLTPQCKSLLTYLETQKEIFTSDFDFITLRNKPVIKQDENKYQIVYKRFFIEKLFKGLYFEIKLANDQLDEPLKNFRDNLYCDDFSEVTLLYDNLNHIYRDYKLKIKGKDIETDNPQFGPSDYICKQDGDIIFFESKDVLIKKEVKVSRDAQLIRDALRKKFYKDGNQPKALLQLASNIKKFYEGKYSKYGLPYEDKFQFCYAVIVVHSDTFNILGLNDLLNQWWREALLEVGIPKGIKYKIKNVVIVDINNLIFLRDSLNSKRNLKFNKLIDQYFAYAKHNYKRLPSQEQYMEHYVHFGHFINTRCREEKKRNTPELISSIIKEVQSYMGVSA